MTVHVPQENTRPPGAAQVLDALKAWGLRGGRARCPGHNGGDRNLSVRRAGDRLLMHCHSHGCSYQRILAGLGMDRPQAPPRESLRREPVERLQTERAEFPYFRPDGSIAVTVIRLDYVTREGRDKSIWRYPKGAEAPPEGWPLFRLPSLLVNRAPILFVEGEKTAEAAQGLFEPTLQATCTIGGAGKASHSDFRPVEGRECRIWPDADEPGRNHAADLARLCREHGATSVAIVPTDDLPPGWDLADA